MPRIYDNIDQHLGPDLRTALIDMHRASRELRRDLQGGGGEIGQQRAICSRVDRTSSSSGLLGPLLLPVLTMYEPASARGAGAR